MEAWELIRVPFGRKVINAKYVFYIKWNRMAGRIFHAIRKSQLPNARCLAFFSFIGRVFQASNFLLLLKPFLDKNMVKPFYILKSGLIKKPGLYCWYSKFYFLLSPNISTLIVSLQVITFAGLITNCAMWKLINWLLRYRRKTWDLESHLSWYRWHRWTDDVWKVVVDIFLRGSCMTWHIK